MAKVQQKSEKISAFGGIFFVLDIFDRILSSVIDLSATNIGKDTVLYYRSLGKGPFLIHRNDVAKNNSLLHNFIPL